MGFCSVEDLGHGGLFGGVFYGEEDVGCVRVELVLESCHDGGR